MKISINENPDKIISLEEKNKILYKFNDTYYELEKSHTIQELFENQVNSIPNSIAVKINNESITYGALNEKANSLARILRRDGLKANDIVGLITEKSIEMIIGILAVIKAGGAYLPIDIEYPIDRVKYILDNSKSKFILYNLKNDLSDELKQCTEKVYNLNNKKLYIENGDNLAVINKTSDLAYVIYTSGTTGQPKGVMIKHENLKNYLCSLNMQFKNGFCKDDIVLSLSNYAFDVSVSDFFIALTNGCKLVLSKNHKIFDIEEICRLIIDNNITYTYIPPSLLNLVCDLLSLEKEKVKINKLFIGVESINGYTAKRYLQINNSMEIINCYGPSEATVCSTIYKVTGNEAPNIPMPIGKPLKNSRVYILDKELNLLPIGSIGELCVSGQQVGLGYLNNEKLTHEKFLSDPFFEGNVMYRTGDLAKWLPDGNIEFCGRVDNQVKIRGYRIELEEIRCILLEHECIKEAVVLIKEFENSYNPQEQEKVICAYILCEKYVNDINELKLDDFLSKKLPKYMIPSHFIMIDKVPLTSNGKVDKRTLLEININLTNNKEEKVFVKPCDEIEEKLSKLFEEILGLNSVSTNDNFFELGGYSLKIAILSTKIQSMFGVKVSVSKIFEFPTIKQLATYIKNSNSANHTSIQKVENKDFYIASPAQKRMYMLQQLDEKSIAYNLPMIIEIGKRQDIDDIQEIFERLIENHEAFRTYFGIVNGEVVQYVLQDIGFRIQEIEFESQLDSCYICKKLNETQIQHIIDDFVKPFNLNDAPLLRVELVQIFNKSYIFVDMHHIISDGLSMNIIINELICLLNGKEIYPSKIEYKDYSEWINDYNKSTDTVNQEEYWLSQFKGEIPVLNMPLDYKRPSVQSFEGDIESITLDSLLSKKLINIQNQTNTTLHMIMLSIINILLSKYTNQEDIIVGTPVSGRPFDELNDIVGMFVNTIPLRNKPESKKIFKEFLSEVKSNSLNAYENQYYQLDMLINKLNIDRIAGRNPLFDIVLNLEDTLDFEINEDFKKLPINIYMREQKNSKFDITFNISYKNEQLSICAEYCTRLFRANTIKSLLEHLEYIIVQVCENINIRLSDIELILPSEKERILNEFNDTDVDYDSSKTVVELFEEQVNRVPNNIAVDLLGDCISYYELNERVNRLAYTLRKNGVKPNDIVGVITERSIEMIIGILAVIKAGGAYMPVDIDFPEERIEYIFKNSKCNYLLYKLNDGLSELLRNKVDYIYNLDDESIYDIEYDNLQKVNKPDDLIYIIYTSGTTGQPKGVMIKHENITNYLSSLSMLFKNGFSENDRILSLANYIFDVSVSEFFISLINGCTLVLNKKHKTFDIREITDLIIDYDITYTYIPPLLLSMVCDKLIDNKDNVKLNKLFIGVEPIKGGIIKKLHVINKDMEIINCYGPSEATICSTIYKVTGKEDDEIFMPIGKPLNNSYVYIVDKNLKLMPINMVGELCVSGAQVGKGYLNKDNLTKEKFVPNPFKSGTTMYKTGDMAKWLPDGNVEFVGRADNQVKIRGYRVELGEITCKLMEYDHIFEAVVLVRELENSENIYENNKYVCAYIVTDENYDEAELREFLIKKLPKYMIPTYIFKLDSLPLTPNGKLDKKSLPNICKEKGDVLFLENNKTEQDIIRAFEYVLNLKNIGLDDDYFKDLGGDSLKAINVIGILNEKYNANLNQIFEYPTARQLAKHIKMSENIIIKQLDKLKEKYKYSLKEQFPNLQVLNNSVNDKFCVEYRNKFNLYDNVDYTDKKEYKHILLTGATGYLGVNLVNSLLTKTKAEIYTIVRGSNKDEATQRLKNNIDFYFSDTFDNCYYERIHVLNGDFSNLNLGLSSKEYDNLSKTIDCIIHCGGNTNHFGKYEIYEKANVISTKNVIEFAKKNNKKDINYISTLSIFEAPYDNAVINATEYDLNLGQNYDKMTVYPKSKYEAELMLDELKRENKDDINVNVFRIGNISFNSKNGSVQRNIDNNAALSIMKCFIELGIVPKKLYDFECGFVDFISDAIINLFNLRQLKNQIYHLKNSELIPIEEFLKVENIGIKLENKSIIEFLDCLKDKINQNEYKQYIYTLITHMLSVYNNNEISTKINIYSEKTEYVLSKTNMYWRKPTKCEIKRFIDYCRSIDFIKTVEN